MQLDTAAIEKEGKRIGTSVIARFDFQTKEGEQILVSTAISGVSMEGAARNLAAEVPDDDFDKYLAAVQDDWNEQLSRIEIKCDDRDEKVKFYTALYHSMIAPTIYSDVDGAYYGPDKQVHRVEGWTNYSTFSLWDTYRAAHPLYTFIEPERVNDMVTTSYPKPTVHKSYFTNEEGYLVLPKNLKPGNYRIEEVTAPDGYTISKNYVTVAVDTDTAYLTDPVTGDAVIDVEYTNAPVKGQLKIYKQGEVLKGFDKEFQFEMAGLAGAEFEVYAAEDIYTADHQVGADGQRTLYFAKDALVATVTTDADGYATVKNLPLGRYYVKEKNAPDTYVLNTVPENVEFAYADQDTAVIEKEISVTDERQKVSITVEKQDAETGNTVAGAVFGIYNAKDIQTKDGKVIVKADTLLQEMTSDEKGQAACTLDLPLGSYYVKELKAPDGFVSSDEVLRFDASYQGQDVQTVTLKSVKKNQPTTVEITKSDATTGVELDGAYLKVTDKDGNVVDSWRSSKDAPHVIKYLKVGETYTLHEEFAPHGYLVANDVTFTVKDTGEVQKVEMKDEVPVGELIINKKGEFLDSVTLADKVKGVVEHIFNYVTGKLTDVTFEVYADRKSVV